MMPLSSYNKIEADSSSTINNNATTSISKKKGQKHQRREDGCSSAMMTTSTTGKPQQDGVISAPACPPPPATLAPTPNPSLRKKQKTTKCVTFAPRTRARRTIRRCDYTDEEKVNTWTTKDEMNEIRSDAVRVVRIMNKDKVVKGDTRRGLECRTRKEVERRQAMITQARKAVFDMQESQRDADECARDEVAIAAACMEASAKSVKLAIRMGEKDAKSVARVTTRSSQRNTNDSETSSSSDGSSVSA